MHNPKREPPVGSKRKLDGKPTNLGKQSSSDTTTKVELPMIDCTVCGGKHSAETVKSYGADYVCSFVHHKHPHVNLEKKPFLESTMGKPYKDHPWNQKDLKSDKMVPQHRLKMKHTLIDGKYVAMPHQELAPSRALESGTSDQKVFLANIADYNDNPYNPYMTLTVPTLRYQDRQGRKGQEGKVKDVQVSTALIDTGAIDSDYISSRLANSISKLGYCIDTSKVDSVHTPFSNMPSIQCVGHMSLKVKFFNEKTKTFETIPLHARVIESPIDIIIGRPTIIQHKLLHKCHDQILADTRLINYEQSPLSGVAFLKNDLWLQLNMITSACEQSSLEEPSGAITPPEMDITSDDIYRSTQAVRRSRQESEEDDTMVEAESFVNPKKASKRWFKEEEISLKEIDIHPLVSRLNAIDNETVQTTLIAMLGVIGHRIIGVDTHKCIIPHQVHTTVGDTIISEDVRDGDIIPKSALLQHSEDGFEETDLIHHPEDDPSYDNAPSEDEYLQVQVHGSEELQRKIRRVVHKYRKVFTSTLPDQPARVTPLHLDVNPSEWIKPSNQAPPRRQSTTKDVEINEQTRAMLHSKVITESKEAQAWSQVLLTLKPNAKWRFVMDFRQLNSSLKRDDGWPLPRIDEVLQRVGNRKPKVFGKMDLTSGYHQMPLAKDSQQYTAFKTAYGLYEWCRVPMGLKNAAAYFQQRMATEVLNGLVNKECEIYLDDVLIDAQTDEEFIRSLENILERLEEKGIVLSPKKCAFGMSTVEILGHTINEKGSHFSREKLEAVLDIKRPENGTQMHSFIGLCNYYRQHVEGIAEMEQPLRRLITAYPGIKKIPWDKHPDEAKAYLKLKEAVGKCPKLFFYDSRMRVYVYTDACNNGIGGYVFQKGPDGTEYPIGFLSKSLKGAELRWSTFEQECYAIQQTLKKFSYLLSDIPFTIRTDHRNLLCLNNEASPKVLRWKWDIQQYNFEVEHIAGVLNTAADLFSRLCVLKATEEERIESLKTFSLPLQRNASGSYLLALNATRRMEPLRPWMKDNRPLDQEVHDIITQVHGWGGRNDQGDITTGAHGHGGVERTLELLKRHIEPSKWWYSMRSDVKQFIRECPQCQFMLAAKLALHQKRPIQPGNLAVGRPMDKVNIDTVGPFEEDEDGNRYIMAFIDVFSRFIELIAVRDLTALTAAKELIKFFGRYGNPSIILTDNGTQYQNELANHIYDRMMVNHISIMPYSHEENGTVERSIKEVNRHLRAIVFDRKIKEKWSMALPLVQRVMNTMTHSSTGVPPSQIIYGNAIDLDRRILHEPQVQEKEGQPYSQYVLDLLNVQAEIIARAQAIQEIVTKKHVAKKLLTLDDTNPPFKPNEFVLWEYSESGLIGDSRPNRLSPHYRGPYRVTQSKDSRIQIQNLITKELHEVLVTQLKPFHYNPNIINPTKVALQAQQEFLPAKIIAIRGNRNKKQKYLRTGLEVHVKWAGYPSEWDSWEPYLELRGTAAFKAYCSLHDLKYLLKDK